jgi:hypothetical protein
MHLCYVDESGSTGKDLRNRQQPVFVMAGILVSDEKWRKTERSVMDLVGKATGGPVPEGFELHACQLLSPEGQGPFEGWDRQKRNELALSILDLLQERKHQVLLQQVHKPRMAGAVIPRGAYGIEWKYPWDVCLAAMFTLFEEYLRSTRTGRSSSGMMIIDHEQAYLALVRDRSKERRRAGGWRQLRKVMEIGYSAVSHANPMIQLADLVAFTERKWAESEAGYGNSWPPQAHEFFKECHDRIWPRVEFKMLRFSKLNVPEDFVSYLKDVRVLR